MWYEFRLAFGRVGESICGESSSMITSGQIKKGGIEEQNIAVLRFLMKMLNVGDERKGTQRGSWQSEGGSAKRETRFIKLFTLFHIAVLFGLINSSFSSGGGGMWSSSCEKASKMTRCHR